MPCIAGSAAASLQKGEIAWVEQLLPGQAPSIEWLVVGETERVKCTLEGHVEQTRTFHLTYHELWCKPCALVSRGDQYT